MLSFIDILFGLVGLVSVFGFLMAKFNKLKFVKKFKLDFRQWYDGDY